jgi:hypothetical protein
MVPVCGIEDHIPTGVRKKTRAQVRRNFADRHRDPENTLLVGKNLPFLGSHPDPSASVGEGSGHPVVRDRRGVAPIEHGEPHPVEAHQPFLSGQPDITVRRLSQAGHRVLRKSVVGRPRIHPCLGLEGTGTRHSTTTWHSRTKRVGVMTSGAMRKPCLARIVASTEGLECPCARRVCSLCAHTGRHSFADSAFAQPSRKPNSLTRQ